jgi:hypothetical protein
MKPSCCHVDCTADTSYSSSFRVRDFSTALEMTSEGQHNTLPIADKHHLRSVDRAPDDKKGTLRDWATQLCHVDRSGDIVYSNPPYSESLHLRSRQKMASLACRSILASVTNSGAEGAIAA